MFRCHLSAWLAVTMGGLIYLFFRPDIVAFEGIAQYTESIRLKADSSSWPVYFFLYCLPDALWYWALLRLQFSLIQQSESSKWIVRTAILLPFVWETLQYFGFCKGTFDWLDIFTYLTVLIITTWKQKTKLEFVLHRSQFSQSLFF